jgi:hypothetical protein
MADHLEVLQGMFPNEILLDVKQITRVLKVSPGHIYNLSSAGNLPFKVHRRAGNFPPRSWSSPTTLIARLWQLCPSSASRRCKSGQ